MLEVDGFGSHGGRTAFEYDRERDADLGDLAIDVRHYSWRQLTVLADRSVAQLRSYALQRARLFDLDDFLSNRVM